MHDTKRSGPCGLKDGHGGKCRSTAGAARERARRTSQGYYDSLLRWKNRNPGRAYLHNLAAMRRRQGVTA